jgi:hypothetical protein
VLDPSCAGWPQHMIRATIQAHTATSTIRTELTGCCCLFQGKLRVYARGDTGYTFGAIAILVRLPSGGPQVYRSARSVPE